MWPRISGTVLGLAFAGALLRFGEACDVHAAVTIGGAIILCGMALALAFVRPEGGAAPPRALALAGLAAGIALGCLVFFARSPHEVANPRNAGPVLCELIFDGSERAERLAAAALAEVATRKDFVVIAYRASDFVRPRLESTSAALFVDYVRTAEPADLPAAVGRAALRPRVALELSASWRKEAEGSIAVSATLVNADRTLAFKGEVFALVTEKRRLGGNELATAIAAATLAQELSLAPAAHAGPWETRVAVPAGTNLDGCNVLLVAADEFVQAFAAAGRPGASAR